MTIWPVLALVALLPGEPVASIRLYNPTGWDGPSVVEVPTGSVATPGLVDWSHVRLVCEGKPLPFSIREGRAHWRAELQAPVPSPRAEDLLVFSCTVPPGAWVQVDVMSGDPETGSALTGQDGRIALAYPDCRAVVDEATGSLLSFEAFGTSLLSAPFSIRPVRLAENAYELSGQFAVGYQTASVNVHKEQPLSFRARCVSSSSTPAASEVNLVLESEGGPAMGLTYRLHASGLLEIAADERPWQGESPWLRHAVEYVLWSAGEPTRLPYLEDRWAFYGFREYTASVKSVACVHATGSTALLELGDQSVNGRRFARRLFPVPAEKLSEAPDLAELADEGLVVEIMPVRTSRLETAVKVSYPKAAAAAGTDLERLLNNTGASSESATTVKLDLVDDAERHGIAPDGFAITADDKGGVVLRAGNALGLYAAVRAVAQHLRRHGLDAGLPLIARNPVVALRGGGFGGGDFEVDLPYGPDEDWRQAFDNLLDSGMNVFACMGMWGNWKMPVGYRYMPELRSDAPDAYDESSGAKFAEIDFHREHGLELARYLQERGGEVWLWIPIGCVPTTFIQQHPEAMAPGSDKFPCFTHPEYRRYIDAFFKELLETYPLDGLFLVRDDNGGLCSCDRCKEFVASSRTKNPAWEQYLVIYDWLRNYGFKGAVAVYPYFDVYEPKLDPVLPRDLYVVGHGSGAAVLSRDYNFVGPMGDTWLDNLYANFRVPPSPRMRRLLADRGSFWIGGAYCGTELPWEAIGRFGWEPTATPNTLRHDWALRTFGRDAALPFLRMNDAYEHLWDINALYMPPADWMKLHERANVAAEGMQWVAHLRAALADLERAAGAEAHARWFGHVRLFAPFFEYHLHRLDLFARIYGKVLAHRDSIIIPADVRDSILADYAEIYDWAAKYDAAMQAAPAGGMLDRCRWMTKPYKEWMAGYDQWLDGQLEIKQFAGTGSLDTGELRAGQAFTLRVELRNRGVCPWFAEAGHRIEFGGVAEKLGLPAAWTFEGEPVAPGDTRIVEFSGTAPVEAGEGDLSVAFVSPYRAPEAFIKLDAKLSWK